VKGYRFLDFRSLENSSCYEIIQTTENKKPITCFIYLVSQLSLSGSVQVQEPQLLAFNFAFLSNNSLIPIPKKASANKKSDRSNILRNTAIFI